MPEKPKFEWHRPPDMATSLFAEFTAEAEAAVGGGNPELLAEIDAAMNTPARNPACLSIDEDAARRLASASGATDGAYFAHLAFLCEIESRKATGPALWERKAGRVPCPDFLPPTSGQIRRSRYGIFRSFERIWNLALIAVVAGIFPFVIIPLSGWLLFKNSVGKWISTLGYVAKGCFAFWIAALVLFAAGFAAARLAGRPPRK